MAPRRTHARFCMAAPMLLAAATLHGCATPDRAGSGLVAPVVVVEPAPLTERVRAALNQPALAGTRWGLFVADEAGREVLSIAPDERFVPASNTKIFTIAAAFMALPGIDTPTPATAVRLEPRTGGEPDVVLVGSGDATLADRADCIANCLGQLADAVARSNVRVVRDMIGDDRLFPDERWGPGWSWNNLQTRSGTAVSALTVNDNEVALTIAPAASAGRPPTVAWVAGDDYYPLRNDAITVADGKTDIAVERLPGSRTVRVYGTIPLGAAVDTQRLGIEDPADFAATRFRRLLEARGVRVNGRVVARHRPVVSRDDPAKRGAVSAASPISPPRPLAQLTAPPLAADLIRTSKISQNLHTELLLRRIGQGEGGTGSIADGKAIVRRMLDQAGVARTAYDFSDGSGMSTYNRVSPRAAVQFLRWTKTQPWGPSFRSSLPVAGVDGTLSNRFVGTPLAGHLFAKTGTLNGVNALAGFLTASSGRELTFALYANDRPADAPSATDAAEAALLLIAAEN